MELRAKQASTSWMPVLWQPMRPAVFVMPLQVVGVTRACVSAGRGCNDAAACVLQFIVRALLHSYNCQTNGMHVLCPLMHASLLLISSAQVASVLMLLCTVIVYRPVRGCWCWCWRSCCSPQLQPSF
jgi:hypothetical protein